MTFGQTIQALEQTEQGNQSDTAAPSPLQEATRRVIGFIDSEDPDATVVDGDGVGAGVVDILEHRNFIGREHTTPGRQSVAFAAEIPLFGLACISDRD